ncbi:MAG TPA: site-specific integrase [Acetobacteraceae bacterium]|jgi:integrase/recombinase XerD|nr:site-specific integrase [Acetobacteraceae bacterium]
MTPQRAQMLEAMILAGLSEGTQGEYVRAVRRLAAYYRRSPDQLIEEEVRHYLLELRQRGVARGTFQIARYGLQFFFCRTLGRGWELFGGKKDRLAAAEAAS